MKYLVKSIFFIVETGLLIGIYVYILKNQLRNFVSYHQPTDISEVLYIVFLIPLSLFLRILLQTYVKINVAIFILQNVILFRFILLDKIEKQQDFIKMYILGIILNLIFYYIDDFCIKKIDKMSKTQAES